ncbi:TPA: hypothetical protein U2M34_000377 [Providencia rettgeri]|nr:hypothetical protein [Providencia rettgeri]
MKFKKSFLMILLLLSTFANSKTFFQCATKDGTINLELIGKDLKLTMKKTTPFLLNVLQNYWRGYSYNHYSRFNTEYYRITYSSNNVDYAIYKNYEDGQYNSGLQVTDLNVNKEYNYDCNKIHIDKLDELLNILECDKGSALGCMH